MNSEFRSINFREIERERKNEKLKRGEQKLELLFCRT